MSPSPQGGDAKDGLASGQKIPSLPFQSLMKSMDDCDRPACEDTVSALSAALGRVQKKGGEQKERKDACPLTSGELGTASWKLLHSMAAWFPDKPTVDDEKSMSAFMSSFAKFYPCTYCSEDFQQNLKKSPVRREKTYAFGSANNIIWLMRNSASLCSRVT